MVETAVKVFNAFGVVNILVSITGDLLNSDKRLDKLLNVFSSYSLTQKFIINYSIRYDKEKIFNYMEEKEKSDTYIDGILRGIIKYKNKNE